MPSEQVPESRMRRAVNDLVLAELFLVQATIESVTAIGDGIDAIRDQITASEDDKAKSEDLGSVIQRTAGDVIEPYTTRFKYLRDLIEKDS